MRYVFSPPISVWLGEGGNTRVLVTNAPYAARLLLEEWPERESPDFEEAAEACLKAVDGGDTRPARAAFENAARRAGILDG